MPSVATTRASVAFKRASILRAAALKSRANGESTEQRQTYYHAAIAASVATWDAYLNAVVLEFFSVVANPLNVPFHAMLSIGLRHTEEALKRFNTPNFERARQLVVTCTGYDPYNDWTWRRRNMGIIQVIELLNQILKVRHSFAHGFSIPAFSWTQDGNGRARLTSVGVGDAQALLRHLVSKTDGGLENHIATTYGVRPAW